jgi:DNA repair photolyase
MNPRKEDSPARSPLHPHGRGASGNVRNPFEALEVALDGDYLDALAHDAEAVPVAPRTKFYVDDSQSLITKNTSPDLSFDASLNPYRGCEHGCSYCYARRYHEFLGFSAGLDFETKIMVKPNAPELLRKEMSSPRWQPQKLSLSGVTDCYQPVERRLKITRGCLEVLAEFRNPVVVITKNFLVTRDADHLAELAKWQASCVLISLTTLDAELARKLEPRASSPRQRLEAVRVLSAAGVPCGVSLSPMIPGLNDHEIPQLLEAAQSAGASFATYSMVRLPGSVATVFQNWLEENVSVAAADKIVGRIREMRGGKLNDLRPGLRMKGEGQMADQVRALFKVTARKLGLDKMRVELSKAHFRRVTYGQGELF